MDPDTPDDRPESPKKKIRPSSTTNSEVSHSASPTATDSVGSSGVHNEINGYGLAPSRRGRGVEASSSSESINSRIIGTDAYPSIPTALGNEAASIQEEVVSSSENRVHARRPPAYLEGNADSLTNDSDGPSRAPDPQLGSEAERK